MSDRREGALRALKRLLANGRLTAMPKRPADQELVAALAAARLDAHATYLESDVNERLKAWLETVSEPFGIDHVTLRRFLVDLRLLIRTTSGSAYRVNPEKAGDLEDLRPIDPTRMLAEIRGARDARKRRHAA